MARPLQASLAGGEVSPELYARAELARYLTSLRTCRNFIIRPHGGATNRAGLRFICEVKTSANATRLLPFIYSTTQAYVVEAGNLYFRFVTGAAQLKSGGTPVEVVTPFATADVPDLRHTQSADVMTLAHPDYAPRELSRTSATAFALATFAYENGPFLNLNTTTTKVYASAKSGAGITLTASAAIFNANHVGGLFYLERADLSDVVPWEPGKKLAGAGANPLNLLRRSDGKIYKCITDYTVPSGKTCDTGTVRPTHESGTAADGDGNAGASGSAVAKAGVDWEFQDAGYGIVQITAYTDTTHVTGTVLVQLPEAVVGGATTAAGPWTMTGDGADTTLSITGATSSDRADYEVLSDGVPLDPTDYTINATTDVLTFNTAPAIGVAISARELAQDNRSDLWAFGAWSPDQGYPTVVEYHGERLWFGGTTGKPDTLWASKVSNYPDFGKSTPLVDDDALKFTLAARQVNAIRAIVPLDDLVVLTSGSEWKVGGGQDGVITPTSINAKGQGYRGAANLGAVLVGETAIYVQDRGSTVRDLSYTLDKDGYTGNDLTIMASHLLEGHTIVDMAYQQVPHSVLWCVRDDGVLLGLTYLREHEVVAWHRHDTDGVFESVAVIPEGTEDAVYFVVKRTIGGVTKRYIERLASRYFADVVDAFFVDSGLSYDGRNTTATTMTVSGSGWTVDDDLTMTASVASFASTDVGDQLELTVGADTVRFDVKAYTDTTHLTVRPLMTVPTGLRAVATTTWTFRRDTMSGLDHLNGKTAAVLSDGNVETTKVVSGGAITLDRPGGVVHVGLPITADLETLELQFAKGDSIRPLQKAVPRVDLLVRDTRGLKVGADAANLYEPPPRENEAYTDPNDPQNGVVETLTSSTWNDTGRVLIRQDQPLPATVLGIIPEVKGGA